MASGDFYPVGLEPGVEVFRLLFQTIEFGGVGGDLLIVAFEQAERPQRAVGRAEDPVAEGADHERDVAGRHKPSPRAQQAVAVDAVAGNGEVTGHGQGAPKQMGVSCTISGDAAHILAFDVLPMGGIVRHDRLVTEGSRGLLEVPASVAAEGRAGAARPYGLRAVASRVAT